MIIKLAMNTENLLFIVISNIQIYLKNLQVKLMSSMLIEMGSQ